MNVAVVMGGYSDESVISLRSGQLILNHLDKSKYKGFEIHILINEWYCLHENTKYPIDKSDFSITYSFILRINNFLNKEISYQKRQLIFPKLFSFSLLFIAFNKSFEMFFLLCVKFCRQWNITNIFRQFSSLVYVEIYKFNNFRKFH